jgi:hypothetical protein
MAENEGHEGLWFEDAPSSVSRPASRRRRVWVLVASVACIAALVIPLALAFSSTGPSPKHAQTASHLTRGVAEQNVLSALSATTSSGSFNVSYEFDPATQPTVTTTTTTTMPTCHVVILAPSSGLATAQGASVPPPAPSEEECTGSVSGPSSIGNSSPTTGHGTIDTDPFAMVAVSNVPGLGEITLRDNGTDVWEFGGADYGLSPGSSENGPGASLTGFAGLVEGTLGARQGALAMGGLSSPTGYLDLDQSMITGADQTGTSTVDGVPVTVYEISIDPAQDANVPGVNAEEAEAIKDSSAILQQQGYTGSTVQVSIDASGYIRETHSVAHFSDGSTTTSWSTFSDFGCAGTVLMPGQTGPTTPPAGCVSPDTGVAPTTTTTSTLAQPALSPTTVPSTVPSTARTTVPSTVLPTTSTTVIKPPSTSTSTTSTTTSTSTTVAQGVTTTTSG